MLSLNGRRIWGAGAPNTTILKTNYKIVKNRSYTTTDVSKSISNFNFKRLATWLGSIFEFRRKMTEIRRKSSEITSICTYLSGLTMNEDKQLRYNYMCTSK